MSVVEHECGQVPSCPRFRSHLSGYVDISAGLLLGSNPSPEQLQLVGADPFFRQGSFQVLDLGTHVVHCCWLSKTMHLIV